MSRSFTVNLVDDKGRVIADAWARAFRNDTQVEVETRYTDDTGCATFTTLPENVDCSILCLWGRQSQYFFSEATIGTTEIDNSAVTSAKIADLAVDYAKIANAAISTAKIADAAITDAKINDCSISRLTAGNLSVVGTITSSGKFITAVSPNPRIEITQTLIVGYSDATTKQFYLQASDGKAYFGGGTCILDSGGAKIRGGYLLFYDANNACIGNVTSQASHLYVEGKQGVYLEDTAATYYIAISTGDFSIGCSRIYVGGDSEPMTNNYYSLGTSLYYWKNVYTENIYRTNEYSFQHYDDIALIRQMKENPAKPGYIDKTTMPDIIRIPPKQVRQEGKERATSRRAASLAQVDIAYPEPCPEKAETIKKVNDTHKKTINDIENISDDDLCNIDTHKEISLAFGAIRQIADRLDALEAKGKDLK